MRIANSVGCTMEELGTRMSAFEYSLRVEAHIYESNPKTYRTEYQSRVLSVEEQVAQLKRVLD